MKRPFAPDVQQLMMHYKGMEKLFKHFAETPLMFDILAHLADATSGSDDAGQAAALVHQDDDLAAAVLALGQARAPANTLVELAGSVGPDTFLQLVTLLALRREMPAATGCYQYTETSPFDHAIAAAELMVELGEPMNHNAGISYLIGAMHGSGELPIARFLDFFKPNANVPVDIGFKALLQWEKREVGHDQTQVGAHLLERWQFPREVYAAVRHQHYPLLAMSHKERACQLHLCRLLLPAVLAPNRVHAHEILLPEGVLVRCGHSKTGIVAHVDAALERLRETRSHLRALEAGELVVPESPGDDDGWYDESMDDAEGSVEDHGESVADDDRVTPHPFSRPPWDNGASKAS